MGWKSHRTAVAFVPPSEAWGPIQEVRRVHDRQFHRWMPHLNLLYPFLDPCEEHLPRLLALGERIPPFEVTFSELHLFRHPTSSATIWIAPEPAEPLIRLQAALAAEFIECDDLGRFERGFTPHLSLGQCRGEEEARHLIADLRVTWKPLCVPVRSVALICRGADTPFRIVQEVPLGGGERRG